MFAQLIIAASLTTALPQTAMPPGSSIDGLFGQAADPTGPGCAISVYRDGQPVLERAFGLANLEQSGSITADTVFEAGSVSKQVAAAVLLALEAQGRLSLDDDIRTYLPEMPVYVRPITVRMLLTHVSGIRNWDDLAELEGYGRGNRVHTQADAFAMITRQTRTSFDPGSEYLYSNSNYVLAMLIAERAGGRSYAELSRDLVLTPAGMARSRWRTDHTAVVPGRAQAYTPDDAGVLHLDMPYEDVVGPGGLLTTIADLQSWNAFLDHPPEDARAWVKRLTDTRQILTDGTETAYGLGLEFEEIVGRPAISHAGSTGGYRAYLARVPDQALSAAILCNAGALNTEDLGPRLVALFLPPVATAETPSASNMSNGQPVPADLAGAYRNTGTRQLVAATIDEDGMHFNGGPPFNQTGVGTLMNANGSRSVLISRTSKGAVQGLRLSRIGNSPVLLEPVTPWTPARADLALFEGLYSSEEAKTLWRVAVDGDVLRATGPTGQSFFIDPIYEDVFAARDAYWTFVFERDPAGSLNGFQAFKTRTRGIAFSRVR